MTSQPWIREYETGTSLAAPAVAAEAALLMQAGWRFPQEVKAIIMATAWNNVSGDSRLSDKDGAGAVDVWRAYQVVKNNQSFTEGVQREDFPKSYMFHADEGARVRVVVAWNSRTEPYPEDHLDADLDLYIWNSSGGLICSSTSWDNSYEIVEFTAPYSGDYVANITFRRFDSPYWYEYIGFAWDQIGKNTLNISATEGFVTITPQLGSHDYWSDDGVHVVAIWNPNECYFSPWELDGQTKYGKDITQDSNTIDVVMESNHTLKAYFKTNLTVLAQDEVGNPLTTGDVYIDDELAGYTGSALPVITGTHEVRLNDFWESNNTGKRYGFKNWTDGSLENPRNITVTSYTTKTANFNNNTWPGDVDGDAYVGIDDLVNVSERFGNERGDANWDSRCDLSCDKYIGIDDIIIVAENFGNSYE